MAILANLGWDSYTTNAAFDPSTPTIGTADELGTGVTLGEVGNTFIIAGVGVDPTDGTTPATAAWRAQYNTGGNQEIHINLPSDQPTWSMRIMWRFASTNGVTVPRWIWLQSGTDGDVTYSAINGTNYDVWFFGSGNQLHIENWNTTGGGYIFRRTELKYDENVDGLIHVSTWNDPMDTGPADFTSTVTPFSGANAGAINKIMLGHTTVGNIQPHFYLDNVLVTDTYEDLGPPPYSTGADVNLTGTVGTGVSNVLGGLPVERAFSGDITATGLTNVQGIFGTQGIINLTGDVGTGTTDVGGMFYVERGFSGTITTDVETNGVPLVGITALDVPYAAYWATGGPGGDVRLDDPTGVRLLDIYYPEGTPPPNGWPIVVWCHGGKWNQGNKIDILEVPTGGSSDNGAAKAMLDELISRGIAVASVGYRLSADPPNGPSPNVVQWPDHIDDIQLAMSFLLENSSSYQIDMRFPVLAGHSAGGYLALMQTLTACLPSTTVDYWDQPNDTPGFVNMDAGTRYTGGPFTVQPVRPIGIGMWEAPTDLHWNSYREGVLSGLIVADNSIRGLLGDDDYFGDTADPGRIAANRADPPSPAFIDLAPSQWITSDIPPAFYVCCQTVSWTNTPVATLNNGVTFTGGNGYALREEWAGQGVPFEEHVIPSANHDDINNYASIDFANWVEHLLNLEMSGTINTGMTVGGMFEIQTIHELDGTAAGTGVATGTLQVVDLNVPIAGSAAGSGTAGGSLTKTAPILTITGTAAGTSTATGTLTVVDAPTYDLSGSAAGVGVTTGTLSIQVADTIDLTGTAIGDGNAVGTLTSVAPPPVDVAGTAAGVGAAAGSLTVIGGADIDLDGTAIGDGTITGTLTKVYTAPTHNIAGIASGVGAASGSLQVVTASFVDLYGVASGTSGTLGFMSKILPTYVDISGSAAGSATATGTVFAAPPGAIDLTGQTDGTSTATGTLQVYDIALSKWWYRDANSIVEVELIGWMDANGDFVSGTYPTDLEYLDAAP